MKADQWLADYTATYVERDVRQLLNVVEEMALASGVPVRIGDILDTLLRLTGVDAAVVTPEARRRAGDLALQVGDGAALRKAVDWAPEYDLETSLRDMIAAARA